MPFFRGIPEDDFARIVAILKPRTIPANEVIVSQGGHDKSLFLIVRGVVRVTTEFDGVETDVASLIAGDFFGEMALLRGGLRTATCKAVTPCVVFELRAQDFERAFGANPHIRAALEAAEQERRQALDGSAGGGNATA